MSSAPRIVDPANVQALIYKVLERHQIKVQDMRDLKKALVVVHGKGQFDCTECTYRWVSHFSWIRVDLREMEISYRWRMKCRNCAHRRGASLLKPTFSLEETEEMIEKAVCAYKGVQYVSPYRRSSSGDSRRLFQWRPPHLPQLCEKCDWGQVKCWTLPPYKLVVKA